MNAGEGQLSQRDGGTPATAHSPAAGGRILAHFELVRLLGRGGMGEVYLAQDRKIGRLVALKLLLAVFGADGERLRRFETEARAAGALNHPNIVTVYE